MSGKQMYFLVSLYGRRKRVIGDNHVVKLKVNKVFSNQNTNNKGYSGKNLNDKHSGYLSIAIGPKS